MARIAGVDLPRHKHIAYALPYLFGIGRALGRFLGYLISTIALYIGLIWAAFDPRKQGWHDKIASTFVVRKV